MDEGKEEKIRRERSGEWEEREGEGRERALYTGK